MVILDNERVIDAFRGVFKQPTHLKRRNRVCISEFLPIWGNLTDGP